MRKKIIIMALIFIVLLLSYFLYSIFKKQKENIIKAYGNIEIRQVDLSFQVSGVIKQVFVEEGDYVKKGEILAELDNRDYLAKYNQAINQEKTTQAQAKEDFDRYKRNLPLCKDGTISFMECDTLLNKKNLSSAQFKQSSANREFQKNQLDYTKMFAPQDGIISTRAQEIGARVSENEIVYVMNLTEPVWVRTYISERDLGNIKYGQRAKILTDTLDIKTKKNKEYIGKIGYISPVAEFTPKTVQTQDLRTDLVYRIRIYIDKTDDFLRQGMPVSVVINLGEEK